MRNLSINFEKNETMLNIKTVSNILQKEFLIDVTSKMINNTIKVNSNIIFPNTTVSSEIYLDIFNTSYLKIGDFFLQYDINNKYLFKLMLLDVTLEFAHQNQKGEIFVQFHDAQLETSYVCLEQLKSKLRNNFLTLNLEITKDNFTFLKQHSGHHTEIIFLNNLDQFKLGFTSFDLPYKLEVTKNLTKLLFQFEHLFLVEFSNGNQEKSLVFHSKDYFKTVFNSSKTSIEFNGDFPKLNTNLFGKLQRSRLFAETLFKFERDQKTLIHFKEFHDSTKMGIVFEFDDFYVKLNHEYLNSKMMVHIKKEPHEISYEFSDLGYLKFLIRTPSLVNNGFKLSTSVKLPINITFSISTIDDRVLTKFNSSMTPHSFNLNFEVLNTLLNKVSFETIWGKEIFKTLNTIKIESTKLGNVSIVGNFDLKRDGLDIETHLKVPFLEGFENFDGEVHINKNLTPWFYVTLPNNKTYSIKAIYVNNQSLFNIDLGFHAADKIYGFKIDYKKDSTLVTSEVVTPFEGYNRYGFSLKKENNLNFLTVNINDRLYILNTKSNVSNKSQMLTINLETPFKSYEKYYFEIQHEDSVFNCFLFYPGLKRLIGFGFNSKSQHGVKFKITLPFPVHGFEHSAFEININNNNVTALSELNNNYIKLNLQINKPNQIFSIFETNHNKIEYKMNDIYENYILYNNNYIYNFNFYDSFHVYIDFHYRKFSVTYDLHTKNFQIKVWDPNNPKNKYGSHLIKTNEEISIGLYFPSKILVIDCVYNVTTHGFNLFWNEEKFVAFQWELSNPNFLDFHFKLNLFIPNREFKFEQVLKLGIITTTFQWDKNEESQINYRCLINDRSLESTLSAGFLHHDVIFKIDFTPFGFVLEIRYSHDHQKTIQLEMFYNKTYIDNVIIDERRFALKHPHSKLDHTLISRAVTSEKHTNITVIIQYVDFVANKPDFMKISLEIGRQEFEISASIESKRNSLLIYSKSTTDVYSKGLQLTFKINNKEPLNLNYLYVFRENSSSFKFLIGYGHDRHYNFYVGIPNKKEITTRLHHNIYGEETTDGMVTLKLNTTSLLWMKILWKPNDLYHFYKTIIEEYADVKYVIQATGRQLIDVVNDETGTILLEEYRTTTATINEVIEEETGKIWKDFKNVENSCQDNTLYCRDVLDLITLWLKTPIIKDIANNILHVKNQIVQEFSFTLNQMEIALNEIKNVKSLKETAKRTFDESFENAKLSFHNMRSTAVKLIEDLQTYLLFAKNSAETIFKPALNLIDEFLAYFEHQKTYVQIIALDAIENVQVYALNLQEVKDVVLIYNKVTTWKSSLNIIDLFGPVWDIIEIIVDTTLDNINYVCDEYIPILSKLKTLVLEEYKPWFPTIKEIKNNVEGAYQKLVWFWRYYDLTGSIKNYVHTKATTYIQLFVKNVFGNTKDGLGIFDYTYNQDTGVIEVSQRLPVEWESFDKSPKFEQHPLYNHIFEKISSFTLDRLESILSKIQMFIYTILNTTIKPPSNNMGMIIAKSHFITFNNKHFDFTGDCSYLLINNFDTNSFSVTLNSDQNRSLTITTNNDSATIDISNDGLIMFNSELVEFPLLHDDFHIYREDESIVFGNHQGLSIICNLHYDYCTFKVSEWLFGKIGGMLGTMDNEPSTDMRKPNGSNVDDVEDFAESWRAGQCSHQPSKNATQNTRIPTFLNKALDTVCSQTFLISNSTLSSCFPIVDPKPFHELCLNSITKSSNTVCSSIAGYKQMCSHKHIVVKMPDFCVNCNLNDVYIDFEDERIFDGHNPKSIDVVFIQEKGCLPNIDRSKHSLNNALEQKGFIKNRFSSVIYGGNTLIKPFLKTVNGSIWTNNTVVMSNPIKILQRPLKRIVEVDEAIKYAAKLEFRPAVTKIFILVQCETCSEMLHSPELYNLLGEKNAILHIIKPNPFVVDNSMAATNLLAIDSTKHHIDNKGVLKEGASNEKFIDSLKDMCCGLAISTSGTVAKSSIFEQYTEKWAELIAGTARQCSCQKCRCIQKANGVGKTECNRCMSPLVKQLMNEYESQHVRL